MEATCSTIGSGPKNERKLDPAERGQRRLIIVVLSFSVKWDEISCARDNWDDCPK